MQNYSDIEVRKMATPTPMLAKASPTKKVVPHLED
jgi:hypothetical protein